MKEFRIAVMYQNQGSVFCEYKKIESSDLETAENLAMEEFIKDCSIDDSVLDIYEVLV